MVRAGLIDSDQHEKIFCIEETSAEVHICIIHSALDNISPHFVCYFKKPSIHELRNFGCDIYPITSYPKIFYDRTQKGSCMFYTTRRATIKWWYPHTKILKYCSSEKID